MSGIARRPTERRARPVGLADVRLLWLLVRVNARQAWRRLLSLRQQSRLLTSVIGLFVVGYCLLSFLLFYHGLRFIGRFPGLGAVLTERLLFLLFAFLFLLLLFSNLVISYTSLFRNRETAFLLTLPVPAQTVLQWKLCESSLLASWAFVFLVAPLLAAYGLTQHVPWHFYIIAVLLLGVFIVLPAVAGTWFAIHLARFLDRRLFQVALLLGASLLLVATAVWMKPEAVTEEMLETRVLVVLDRLLDKTRFAMFPLLPSYWLSTSVIQWAERSFAGAAFFAAVLLSHALFFGSLAVTRFGGIFYDAASAVQSRGSVLARWGWFQQWQARRGRSVRAAGWLEVLFRLCRWIPADVRAVLVKDVRTFWRDTTQWGQSIMLFGLLGVYILNLRHFSQQLNNAYWVHLVSFLNLTACSLNLATVTTRFVFPQFSLEGKRVWIIGLAPLGLVRIVRAKFGLAVGGSLMVTLALIWLSCQMLQLPLSRTLFFSVAVVVMTLTLNGMAAGLGALYPNFKEENPSKIVSGFGGTFCLVLSFLYIVGSVILLATGSPWGPRSSYLSARVFLHGGAFLGVSAILGWLPYHLGLRRVAQFEVS